MHIGECINLNEAIKRTRSRKRKLKGMYTELALENAALSKCVLKALAPLAKPAGVGAR